MGIVQRRIKPLSTSVALGIGVFDPNQRNSIVEHGPLYRSDLMLKIL